jgi:uncharacterized protein
MIIQARISPRSSQNRVIKNSDGSFKIFLTAAPIDNKANESLIKLLSAHFDVGKTKIKILRGESSKNKTIEIII